MFVYSSVVGDSRLPQHVMALSVPRAHEWVEPAVMAV